MTFQKRLHFIALLLAAPFGSALGQPSQTTFSGDAVPLESLNFSSSSPLIFGSVFGLLQQWSNTFFPYGRAIAPCEIPVNTNLYHARTDERLPPSLEWFAFDVAMAYAIAGVTSNSYLLTYRTTKTAKCMYFDGASAALNGVGNMESQMVFLYNSSANIPPNSGFGRPDHGFNPNDTDGVPRRGMLDAEYDRAKGLCKYIERNGLGGRGWGYEGIVRMNAAFEMIWCDFTSPSARLVSQLYIGVPSLDEDTSSTAHLPDNQLQTGLALLADKPPQRRPQPPGEEFDHPFTTSGQLGWLLASTGQYGFSGGKPGRGEVRVKLDSCGIFTFYDPALYDQEGTRISAERDAFNLTDNGVWLAPNSSKDRQDALVALTRRRRSHRATNVSTVDGVYMNGAVTERLRQFIETEHDHCSGTDWHRVSQDIVLTYSSTLWDLKEWLLEIPEETANRSSLRQWLSVTRGMAHQSMMPYYQYPSGEAIYASPEAAFSIDSAGARQAFVRCKEQYSLASTLDLAQSERLTHQAVQDVLGAICHFYLVTFLSAETIWYSHFETQDPNLGSETKADVICSAATTWRERLEEVMAWLGWADQWTACRPGCTIDQECAIPMWPVSFDRHGGPGGHRGRGPTHGGPPDHSGPPAGAPNDREGPPRYGGRPGSGHPGFDSPGEDGLWEPTCRNRTGFLLGR